jgi:hypothetical protein
MTTTQAKDVGKKSVGMCSVAWFYKQYLFNIRIRVDKVDIESHHGSARPNAHHE